MATKRNHARVGKPPTWGFADWPTTVRSQRKVNKPHTHRSKFKKQNKTKQNRWVNPLKAGDWLKNQTRNIGRARWASVHRDFYAKSGEIVQNSVRRLHWPVTLSKANNTNPGNINVVFEPRFSERKSNETPDWFQVVQRPIRSHQLLVGVSNGRWRGRTKLDQNGTKPGKNQNKNSARLDELTSMRSQSKNNKKKLKQKAIKKRADFPKPSTRRHARPPNHRKTNQPRQRRLKPNHTHKKITRNEPFFLLSFYLIFVQIWRRQNLVRRRLAAKHSTKMIPRFNHQRSNPIESHAKYKNWTNKRRKTKIADFFFPFSSGRWPGATFFDGVFGEYASFEGNIKLRDFLSNFLF